MGIDIFISNQTLKKWFLPIISEVVTVQDFVFHNCLESLYSNLLNRTSKQLIILDIEDQASIEYFNLIYTTFDNVQIIAIGLNKPFSEVIEYFKLGFKGFIDINFSSVEVFQIINKVMNGCKYLSLVQQDYLLNILCENTNSLFISSVLNVSNTIKHVIKDLTEKEKRVCELLIKGMTYKEIANAIGVSSFTINQRVKGIYKKLDVRSRGELSFRYLS